MVQLVQLVLMLLLLLAVPINGQPAVTHKTSIQMIQLTGSTEEEEEEDEPEEDEEQDDKRQRHEHELQAPPSGFRLKLRQ